MSRPATGSRTYRTPSSPATTSRVRSSGGQLSTTSTSAGSRSGGGEDAAQALRQVVRPVPRAHRDGHSRHLGRGIAEVTVRPLEERAAAGVPRAVPMQRRCPRDPAQEDGLGGSDPRSAGSRADGSRREAARRSVAHPSSIGSAGKRPRDIHVDESISHATIRSASSSKRGWRHVHYRAVHSLQTAEITTRLLPFSLRPGQSCGEEVMDAAAAAWVDNHLPDGGARARLCARLWRYRELVSFLALRDVQGALQAGGPRHAVGRHPAAGGAGRLHGRLRPARRTRRAMASPTCRSRSSG